jgi:L-cysteine desulfidase
MSDSHHNVFIQWLKQEVTPALGCTEPVAIAFAAATACRHLKGPCIGIYGTISENLYKNATGVTIPGTRLSGVNMAAAVGVYGGNPDYGLEALKDLTPSQVDCARALVDEVDITACEAPDLIHIDLTAASPDDHCRVVIKKSHTNITELYVNDRPEPVDSRAESEAGDTALRNFSVREAFEFINTVPLEEIEFILEAARLNGALSQEGLRASYGLGIGRTLSDAVTRGQMSDDLPSRILIETVAASDARMGGAPVTAMSNFGSGNQGITATLPVMVLARELNVSEEELIQALALSHLVAISVHARYTRLSALCAASTAAMGAAAGMAWLFTRDLNVIESAIINMVSDVSGIICDGASGSCAMKVSTVTQSAFKAVLMAKDGIRVSDHDGIVGQDVEDTLNNLSRLVVRAMPATDKEIIHIMTEKSTATHAC